MLKTGTGCEGEAGTWLPLVYRGDGAWIGVMPGGQVGVGVESEGRATLRDSGYVPLWPFMERGLSEYVRELSRVWVQLEGRGFAGPGAVVELTVSSAWASGRLYWKRLAASWVVEMADRSIFSLELLRDILDKMIGSDALSAELRESLRHASFKLAGPGDDTDSAGN
ncbi:hypothetical protein EV648_10327 [Kribbella sp. VKM Ac-2568]|nr:hypothetical protein EV648_10327 [Kribbella sp. VKM Ac-2568]